MKTLPTQEDVETKTKEIMKKTEKEFNKDLNRITNIRNFLYKNYQVLLNKNRPTRLDTILINDCQNNTLPYKAPEQIELNFKTICFYMAMKELNIEPKYW
jgi:hypothetical protein